VPGFEILETLGRGGMGVVYKARQIGLDRLVALKMILAADPETALLERFHTEALAAARLRHPGIVQIHEVGAHEGRPYLVLEFVEGGSLASKLKGKPVPPRQAAQLAESLGRAVQAAHDAGIVHRDLKPANVLVTPKWELKVADFGLAKCIDREQNQTQTGAILGTPAYMAPEQALGRSREVGPAADIYALGVILYELLTGRPPFAGGDRSELFARIEHEAPVPPSRLVKVTRDLETVCLKCLEKRPEDRYASAAACADDLARFLRGEPIAARPIGRAGRLGRWSRRRPAAAGLLAAVVVVAALVPALFWLVDRLKTSDSKLADTTKGKEQAEKEKEQAEWETGEEFRARKLAEAARLKAEGNTKEVREKREKELLQNQTLQKARIAACWPWNPGYAATLLKEEAVWAKQEDADAWWTAHDQLCRFDRGPASGCGGAVSSLTFSPDGKFLVMQALSGMLDPSLRKPPSVRLFDVASGRLLRTMPDYGSADSPPGFSTDGKFLAVAKTPDRFRPSTASFEQYVKIVPVPEGPELGEVAIFGGLLPACMLPAKDGLSFIGVSQMGVSETSLKGPTRDPRDPLHRPPSNVQFGKPIGRVSPDGKRIAVFDTFLGLESSRNINVIDVKTKESKALAGPTMPPKAVAFSPDGMKLAAVIGPVAGIRLDRDGSPQELWVWDLATEKGNALASWKTFPSGNQPALAFLPDGKSLAVTRVETGQTVVSLAVFDLATGDPRDSRLLSADADHGPGMVPPLNQGLGGSFMHLTFSRDGGVLGGASFNGQVRLWDTATGKTLKVLPSVGHLDEPTDWAFSPASGTLATCLDSQMADHSVRLWDVKTGEQKHLLRGHAAPVRAVAVSPDGSTLASVADNPSNSTLPPFLLPEPGFGPGVVVRTTLQVLLWDIRSGRQLNSFTIAAPPNVSRIRFSPDGLRLALGGGQAPVVGTNGEGEAVVIDAMNGKLVQRFKGHLARVTALAFSPDGTMLYTGAGVPTRGDGIGSPSLKGSEVIGWEVASGKEKRKITGLTRERISLEVSADGRTLVAAILDMDTAPPKVEFHETDLTSNR
jgi:WD40 repeat protein